MMNREENPHKQMPAVTDPGDVVTASGPSREAAEVADHNVTTVPRVLDSDLVEPAASQIVPWADDFLEECEARLAEFNATADKKSPDYPGALADIVNEVREEFERGYAKLGYRIPPGVKEILGDHLIGPEAYQKVFGATDLGVIPAIPEHITKELLNQRCRFTNYRSFIADTHCLIFIPGKIDGEPFTIMKLAALSEIAASKIGRPKMFDDISWCRDETFARMPKETGEWVLVPTLDLPNSRNRTYTQQEFELGKYPEYRVATALELIAMLIMRDLLAKPSRESIGPYHSQFGRCSDATKFGGHVSVGVMNSDGLDINFTGEQNHYDDLALAIVRK